MARPRGFIDDWQPRETTANRLADVQRVLEDYNDYLPVTVRQIFYRLVGEFQYAKSESLYKQLVEDIAKARRARIIPMDSIRDDGVSVSNIWWDGDVDGFRENISWQARNYERDRQEGQPRRIWLTTETAGMKPQLEKVVEPRFFAGEKPRAYNEL